MATSTIKALGNWEYESATTTGGDVVLRVNKTIKLAILYYNSKTVAGNFTITLSNIISMIDVYVPVRGGGYLALNQNSNTVSVEGVDTYGCAELVFPIK